MLENEYYNLIMLSPFGYAKIKAVFDDKGNIVDDVFIEINQAIEKVIGLKSEDIANKRVSDIINEKGSLFNQRFKIYESLNEKGKTDKFLFYITQYDIWIETRVTCIEPGYYTTISYDNTKEVKLTEELQKAKELYELAVSSFSGYTWDRDYEKGAFVFSEEFGELLGYQRGELELTRETLSSISHQEDLKKLDRAYREFMKTKETVFNGKIRMLHKNGYYIWVSVTGKAVRGVDGQISRFVVTIIDINEKVKAEEKLANSERNFRLLFDNMISMLFIIRDNGTIINCNTAAINKLGYTKEEIMEKKVFELHPCDIKMEVFNKEQALVHCSRPFQNKNGSLIHVETRKWQGQWDGQDCVFILALDISKEFEQRELAYSLFHNNPAIISLIEFSSMTYYDVNESYLKLLNYEKDEMIGKTPKELNIYQGDSETDERFRMQLLENKSINGREVIFYDKHMNKKHTLISSDIVSSGGKEYILTAGLDLTNIKKTQIELEHAKEAAEAANKAKSQFLSNMSHEIRTPLNGIIGFTELILGFELQDNLRQYANLIKSSGEVLLNLINDLLNFSKIEAGELSLKIEKHSMIRLLEESVDIVKYQAYQKGLELIMDIQSDMPEYALFDEKSLKQIMLNLLGNAVKFTNQGEVLLKVEFESKTKEQGVYKISVIDTGIGIKKEDVDSLFKPFIQADSLSTREHGGTGLGLAISQNIAEKMGSKIHVASQLDKGSKFFFNLETKYFENTKNKAFEQTNYKSCLVIDKNDSVKKVLSKLFAEYNASCFTAANWKEAEVILQEMHDIDLILIESNIYLGDLTNSLYKYIKEKEIKADIVLLVDIINYQFSEQQRQLFKAVATLIKPIKGKDIRVLMTSERLIYKMPNNETVSSLVNTTQKTILIAEDTLMNAILIANLIRQYSPNSNIIEVANGKKALEEVLKNKIDLILMDVQMPIMDGIETTKLIRKEEERTNKHIPIIALTAGVLAEEKKRCLDAGMDDFITKPINTSTLNKILSHYLLDNYEENNNNIQEDNIDEKNHFDKEAFLSRIDYDMGFYREMLMAALELEPIIQELYTALENNNKEMIKKLSHKLKGSSLNMSFNELVKLFKEIEVFTINGLEAIELLKKEWLIVKGIISKELII